MARNGIVAEHKLPKCLMLKKETRYFADDGNNLHAHGTLPAKGIQSRHTA
jgi:hypothetical protein